MGLRGASGFCPWCHQVWPQREAGWAAFLDLPRISPLLERPSYKVEFDPSCIVSVAAVINYKVSEWIVVVRIFSICNKNELRRKKRSFPSDSTPICAHIVASIPPLRVHPMAPASRSRQDVDAWKLGSTVVGSGTAEEVVIVKSNLLWFVTLLACQMSWVQHVPTTVCGLILVVSHNSYISYQFFINLQAAWLRPFKHATREIQERMLSQFGTVTTPPTKEQPTAWFGYSDCSLDMFTTGTSEYKLSHRKTDHERTWC